MLGRSFQVGWQSARRLTAATNLAAMDAIGATRAWVLSQGEGVEVAVFDTGIDLAHPDLASRIAGGINLVSPGAPPQDDHGHGTRVAGIVAAMGRTRLVTGVAPRARLHSVKVLDGRGDGLLSDVIQGLAWAVQRRIRVVNMSLDIREDSDDLRRAIREAVAAGVTIVASVGNGGSGSGVTYPAAYPEVIAVGAVGIDGRPVPFSTAGPEVDLVAPGLGIQTTALPRTYAWASGTSMASAFVAGVAALYLSINPAATPEQVRQALVRAARPLEGLTREQQGAGLVDADETLRAGGDLSDGADDEGGSADT